MASNHFLDEIIVALQNLSPTWKERLQSGLVKLDFAVQVGKNLSEERQEELYHFLRDANVPQKYEAKVLLAFYYGWSEWAAQTVIRIYKLAEKTRASLVMYNDLMDEYEKIFIEDFEYRFLEGKLPLDEELLEPILLTYEKELQALLDQAPDRAREFNRSYGDSSTDSSFSGGSSSLRPIRLPQSVRQLLGLHDSASEIEIKKQYRHLLKILHPDNGGSAYLFDFLKKAYESEQ